MENNFPQSSFGRHTRLIRQTQSSDFYTRTQAQKRLLDASAPVFRNFAKNKSENDVDEAVQSARVAFASNLSKYNPDCGVQYATYARKMMVREVANDARLNYGRPSRRDLADQTNALDDVQASVSAPIWTSTSPSDESGEAASLVESIPDRLAAEAFAVADVQMDVQKFIASLSLREQTVYRLLYSEQKTQAMAASELNISQPAVVQVNAKILRQGKIKLAHLVAGA